MLCIVTILSKRLNYIERFPSFFRLAFILYEFYNLCICFAEGSCVQPKSIGPSKISPGPSRKKEWKNEPNKWWEWDGDVLQTGDRAVIFSCFCQNPLPTNQEQTGNFPFAFSSWARYSFCLYVINWYAGTERYNHPWDE